MGKIIRFRNKLLLSGGLIIYTTAVVSLFTRKTYFYRSDNNLDASITGRLLFELDIIIPLSHNLFIDRWLYSRTKNLAFGGILLVFKQFFELLQDLFLPAFKLFKALLKLVQPVSLVVGNNGYPLIWVLPKPEFLPEKAS